MVMFVYQEGKRFWKQTVVVSGEYHFATYGFFRCADLEGNKSDGSLHKSDGRTVVTFGPLNLDLLGKKTLDANLLVEKSQNGVDN